MGSQNYWTNDDGLIVTAGRRTSDNVAGKLSSFGPTQVLEIVVPAGELGNASEQAAYPTIIPAGATIVDVKLHSDGALTSLVDLVVGVADADGGSDLTDADGLVLAIDAAEVVALRPTGTVVGTLFDGALLTTSLPLSEAVRVTWAATTASAAGDVKIVIEYAVA